MKSPSSVLFFLITLASWTSAHTYVWSVWVNGVDQGTGNGIRWPAYNGPPVPDDPLSGQGSGYRNSPVRDLTKIDMRCNVLGDIPNPETIKVKPGDVVTLEWHHESRLSTDDIIATSHKGSGLVYISPNPPTDSSWVKLQEEGEGPAGVWYVTGKHTQRQGKQDLQIPANLAPGQYLIRGEILALHEADVSHLDNPNRGIQTYISCVQIEITGTGTTTLPDGVGFPGAYNYSSPGIVYNIYSTALGAGLYTIPGPSVWSGAATSPAAPAYGSPAGVMTAEKWYTWIGNGFSTATLATSLTIDLGTQTVTSTYVPTWPTTYVTPTSTASSPAAAFTEFSTPTAAPTRA